MYDVGIYVGLPWVISGSCAIFSKVWYTLSHACTPTPQHNNDVIGEHLNFADQESLLYKGPSLGQSLHGLEHDYS